MTSVAVQNRKGLLLMELNETISKDFVIDYSDVS